MLSLMIPCASHNHSACVKKVQYTLNNNIDMSCGIYIEFSIVKTYNLLTCPINWVSVFISNSKGSMVRLFFVFISTWPSIDFLFSFHLGVLILPLRVVVNALCKNDKHVAFNKCYDMALIRHMHAFFLMIICSTCQIIYNNILFMHVWHVWL